MSITSVDEHYENQTCQIMRTGRTHQRMFRVTSDTATEDPYDVARASAGGTSIPSIGDAHPNDASAFVSNIGPPNRDKDNRKLWTVGVEYETLSADTPEENPLNEDALVEWGFTAYQKIIAKDAGGEPILNSANDPYDPPLEGEKYRLNVRIQRNESSFTPGTADGHINTVNDAEVTVAGFTVAAGKALMKDFSGRSAERSGTSYWVVTYLIEFDPSSWQVELLDHGLYELVGATKRRIERYGEAVTEPQRLDGTGGALAENAAASASVYTAWDIHNTSDWSGLSLDV